MSAITQSLTEIMDNVIVKRGQGRPKLEIPLTDQEKKDRAKFIAKRHYELNTELRKYQKKCLYEKNKTFKTVN